jgi:spore germination protein
LWLLVTGCFHVPAASSTPTEIWGIVTPTAVFGGAGAFSSIADVWIALDTITFRPVSLGIPKHDAENRLAVVTTFQGGRYHPDVVRALGEGGDVLARAVSATTSLLSDAHAEGILIDAQEMTGQDRQSFADFARAFADSARAHSINQIGIVIPAADSVAYPAASLVRSADFLVVRFFPEHGIGTPPGPIVSVPWMARQLGARASQVGVTRIVAGFPADGILWTRESARRVSYAEAVRLAESAGTTFTRDPASRNLHALSLRDGWEIWLVDHESIEALISEARRFGVTRFALFGIDGGDPVLFR